MEYKEFIELFTDILEVKDLQNDYNLILDDLKNNVFPFHHRDKFIAARRYYYGLKQNNSLKYKKLNGDLIKLVKYKIKSTTQNSAADDL